METLSTDTLFTHVAPRAVRDGATRFLTDLEIVGEPSPRQCKVLVQRVGKMVEASPRDLVHVLNGVFRVAIEWIVPPGAQFGTS